MDLVGSKATTQLPTITAACRIVGRGAAVLVASSAAASSASSIVLSSATSRALTLSGGATTEAAAADVDRKKIDKRIKADLKKRLTLEDDDNVKESFLGLKLSPEGKAVMYMSFAMASHYFGYNLARPVTVALFTSSSTGYAGFAGAFPFAMAFVSPAVLSLLVVYGNLLERYGPRGALRLSTLLCATTFIISAIAIAILSETGWMMGSIPLVKLVTGPLFVFRESYVQLLTSQYWSFMSSSLTPNQSAQWFGPIAGLTSITSALAGFAVSPLVETIGLSGALLGTGVTLVLSLLGASAAYSTASIHGFEPIDTKSTKVEVEVNNDNKVKRSSRTNSRRRRRRRPELLGVGMFQKARTLFSRVPVLWALFKEILISQALSTVLGVCFVARLGTAIPDDADRAGWLGVFFALVNVFTMVLQFGLLPRLMTVIEPKDLWRALPITILLCTVIQSLDMDPSLFVVSFSYFIMKVSEYSARRMLDEMVYVPLDFESRFLGKEVLGVFGYRFGKSLMSLAVSGLTSVFGNVGLQQLSMLGSSVSFLWLFAAWNLSNLVLTRQEAEDEYRRRRRRKQ